MRIQIGAGVTAVRFAAIDEQHVSIEPVGARLCERESARAKSSGQAAMGGVFEWDLRHAANRESSARRRIRDAREMGSP